MYLVLYPNNHVLIKIYKYMVIQNALKCIVMFLKYKLILGKYIVIKLV